MVVQSHPLPGGPADDPHLVPLGGEQPQRPAAIGIVLRGPGPQRRRRREPGGDVRQHGHRERLAGGVTAAGGRRRGRRSPAGREICFR
jgi:hypothetical protein